MSTNKNKSIFKKILGLFMHIPEEITTSKQTPKVVKKVSALKNAEELQMAGEKAKVGISMPIEQETNVVENNKEEEQKEQETEKEKEKETNVTVKTENIEVSTPEMNQYKREKSKFEPIVTFNKVSKVFNEGTENEFKALEDIDFEIDDIPDVGEFIALVGPSGCGKSTILNLIQGFQEVGPPTSGEILIRNKPINSPGRDRGMIFQKYSSFPHLTVLENVMFGLELNASGFKNSKSLMEKLSLDMIKKVGMEGHENKYPYQLSGGQQQRVAIARTLVLKPRIILMDEPFSALDEPTRIEMQSLITNLWASIEATVFIVTHSLTEAIYLSDRIFMFSANPGKLEKIIPITPEKIGKDPELSPIVVQESPKFRAVLKEITEDFLRIGGQKHEIKN